MTSLVWEGDVCFHFSGTSSAVWFGLREGDVGFLSFLLWVPQWNVAIHKGKKTRKNESSRLI